MQRAGRLRVTAALGVALVASLALVAAAFGRPDSSAAPNAAASADRQAVACSSARIGVMGPFTGNAASIGQEQLKWAKYALATFNKQNKTAYRMVEADTQLVASQAATRATQLAANQNVVAVIGPAGSQEVQAVVRPFRNLAYISSSATNTSLTVGPARIATFWRVVGNDAAQALTDANFIRKDLNGDNVWIIDDQTSYSVPLANGVQATLKKSGAKVTRESVNRDQSDFSSLITRISSDTDVVFLPWQFANKAAIFYQQLREQGKTAKILGSDGLDSGDFIGVANGSYFSAFAPDIHQSKLPATKRVINGYVKVYGANAFKSNFGPPAYVAMQAAYIAIKAACADGQVTREEVRQTLPKTKIVNTILGGSLTFNKNHDPATARFYLFRVVDGKSQFVK